MLKNYRTQNIARSTNRTCPVFFPAMADSANLRSLRSPKCMAGGFATTRTDSAQFSIEIRPARGIRFSQKRLSFVQERESECKNGEFHSRPLIFLTDLGGSKSPWAWFPRKRARTKSRWPRRGLLRTTASRCTCDWICREFHFDTTATGGAIV